MHRHAFRKNDNLRLNENLDAKAVQALIDAGLRSRFSQLCTLWQQETAVISYNSNIARQSKEANLMANLEKDSPSLTRMFHRALVDAIIEKFPQVFLEILLSYL